MKMPAFIQKSKHSGGSLGYEYALLMQLMLLSLIGNQCGIK
jgi:hypothetical protein